MPAERLWVLADEVLVNRSFGSKEEIEAVLTEPCIKLSDMPDVIRARTLFHWWPRTGPDEHH